MYLLEKSEVYIFEFLLDIVLQNTVRGGSSILLQTEGRLTSKFPLDVPQKH